MSEYAMSISYSMVDNDGEIEAGFHAQSTDGIDVDVTATGDDREEVAKAVLSDGSEKILEQLYQIETNEETSDCESTSFEALQTENDQLRDEISYLRGLVAEKQSCISYYKELIKGNQSQKTKDVDAYLGDIFDELDIDPKSLKLVLKMFGEI